ELLADKVRLLKQLAQMIKVPEGKVLERLTALQQELKQLQKENESMRAKLANSQVSSLLEQAEKIGDIAVVAEKVAVKDMNELRKMVDELKQKISSGIILLAAETNGKVQLAAGVTKDLTDKYHAGKIIKQAAEICGGGGGGRADMAQAGGKDPSKIADALAQTKS